MSAYEAFSAYPLHEKVSGCPCCTGSDAILRRRALAELTADELGRYAFKALTTWGNLADYKHFLPRILELSLEGAPDLGFDPGIIASKLEMGRWSEWPESERQAVTSYLEGLLGSGHYEAVEVLAVFGRLGLPIPPVSGAQLASVVLYWARRKDQPPSLEAWLREPARLRELEEAFFKASDAWEESELSQALEHLSGTEPPR